MGTVFRVHAPYGYTPIEDFWIAGEQSFPQLAEEFGYSSELVNGRWHWYKNEELTASNDEFSNTILDKQLQTLTIESLIN